MNIRYRLRYFDSVGELLGYESIQCACDREAIQRAVGVSFPQSCAAVELLWEDHLVWRGLPAEFSFIEH